MDNEHGKCDICGELSSLKREHYHYDLICECHSPVHFEIVKYCGKCTPKPPEKTTAYIQPVKFKRINE